MNYRGGELGFGGRLSQVLMVLSHCVTVQFYLVLEKIIDNLGFGLASAGNLQVLVNLIVVKFAGFCWRKDLLLQSGKILDIFENLIIASLASDLPKQYIAMLELVFLISKSFGISQNLEISEFELFETVL